MLIAPNEFYRRAFKKGMAGWDVATVQISLNSTLGLTLVVDGDFGPATERAVLQVQKAHGLTQDGICGVNTMRAVCVTETARSEKVLALPPGLLKGIVEGESSYVIPTTTPSYANGTRDIGACQFNTLMSDQRRILEAFDTRAACLASAKKLRDAHDSFKGRPGALTERKAWELAILNHNWEAAAQRLAAGTFDAWRYRAANASGVLQTYGVDEAAFWVERIGVPGVRTARQWVSHYIESKAVYVSW